MNVKCLREALMVLGSEVLNEIGCVSIINAENVANWCKLLNFRNVGKKRI